MEYIILIMLIIGISYIGSRIALVIETIYRIERILRMIQKRHNVNASEQAYIDADIENI